MTDFKVEPAALDKLADLLDRAKEDADAGRKHLAADFVQQNLTSLQQMNMHEVFDEVAEEKRLAEEEAARAVNESEDDDFHEQAPWRGQAQ